MRKLIVGLMIAVAFTTNAQITSQNDGDWNVNGTWSCNCVPDFNDGTISISHEVTIPSGFAVSVDETTIATGGRVIIATSGTLNIQAVSNALMVDGTLQAQQGSSLTGTTSSNVVFNDNSRYIHSFTTTEGSIPNASWNPGSVLEISGYTTFSSATVAGRWGQSFGEIFWDCPDQTSTLSLNGLLVSASSIEIGRTGTGILRLATTQRPIVNITGNLLVSGLSNFQVCTAATSPGAVVNIGGSFLYNAPATSIFQLTATGIGILNIAEDFVMDAAGATFFMANSVAAGTGTMNITGNFDLVNGTITEGVADAAGSNGRIYFVNAGPAKTHTFSNTGTISNRINYRLFPPADVLHILGESQMIGNANSNFTLSGGTLIVESTDPAGAIQTGSGAGAGNIRTATRTFVAGSTIIYQGSAPQAIGNGQNSIPSVIINNPTTVTLNNANSIGVNLANLTILQGDLIVQNNNLSVNGASSVLSIQGGSVIVNSTTATRTLTVNQLVLSGGDLVLNGTNNPITFTGNGTITLNAGDIVFSNAAAIATFNTFNDIALTGGNITFNSGSGNLTQTIRGDVTGSGNFVFTGDNNNFNILGTGSLAQPFPINGPTSIENFTLNRPSSLLVIDQPFTVTNNMFVRAGSVDFDADATIVGSLNVDDGNLVRFEGRTLELGSQFNNLLFGGELSADASSTLLLTGAGALDTLFFAPGGNTIGTILLDRPTGGVLLRLTTPLTVTTALTLRDGIFHHSSGLAFGPGAIVTRDANASFTGVGSTGGPYHVIYEGNAIITTGAELLGAQLGNVTNDNSGGTNLANSFVATGLLSNNQGVFTSGAQNVTIGALLNQTTFNAPSTNLTISGDITNNGTFNANNGTAIFTNNTSFPGSSQIIFSNVQINNSATVISGPTFQLTRNFTNNGTFTASGGTVVFGGSSLQNVSGSSQTVFHNITVTNTSNPSGVSMETPQSMTGTLTMNVNTKIDADGVADANDDNDLSNFTLRSTDDSPVVADARVAPLPSGAIVRGEVRVERFISAEGAGNRYMSSPVVVSRISEFQDNISVTGTFPQTSFPCTGCNNNGASIKFYNEATPGAVANGYSNYPLNSNTEALQVGRGYLVYIWDGSTAKTIDLTGRINSGNVPLPVSRTPSTDSNADGWNLVGNPYPSSIAWTGGAGWIFSGNNPANFGSTITVPDVVGNDSKTYNYADNSGDLTGGVIATGQAFWVYQFTPGATLTVTEQAKVVNSGSFYREGKEPLQQLIVALSYNGKKDKTFLKVNRQATSHFDTGLDALKLKFMPSTIAFLDQDNRELLMHTLPSISETEKLPLTLDLTETGDYTISFGDVLNFSYGSKLFLVDTWEGVSQEISKPYTFSVTKAALKVSDRFYLSMTPRGGELAVEEYVQMFPNPVTANFFIRARTGDHGVVSVFDSQGKQVYADRFTHEKEIDMTSLQDGVYAVKVQTKDGIVVRKIIKTVSPR